MVYKPLLAGDVCAFVSFLLSFLFFLSHSCSCCCIVFVFFAKYICILNDNRSLGLAFGLMGYHKPS